MAGDETNVLAIKSTRKKMSVVGKIVRKYEEHLVLLYACVQHVRINQTGDALILNGYVGKRKKRRKFVSMEDYF